MKPHDTEGACLLKRHSDEFRGKDDGSLKETGNEAVNEPGDYLFDCPNGWVSQRVARLCFHLKNGESEVRLFVPNHHKEPRDPLSDRLRKSRLGT
jgi:hypothetical protein